MTLHDLESLASSTGFTAWATVNPQQIQLKQEVREMCINGRCGMYNKNWSCPPACGSLDGFRLAISKYSQCFLVQTIGEIKDSFDYEAMVEIENRHKSNFLKLRELLPSSTLAAGSGCCTLCPICSYPNDPCRFPYKQISSMESMGMEVSQICRLAGLQYYRGPNTITFTSCYFFVSL